jgi:hypothetical protein
MKPGDLVRVIEKNRVHKGKLALVVRLHPHKSDSADVMIDGQVRRVSLSHFEPVARDEAES